MDFFTASGARMSDERVFNAFEFLTHQMAAHRYTTADALQNQLNHIADRLTDAQVITCRIRATVVFVHGRRCLVRWQRVQQMPTLTAH